jgi:hypothetical protein
MYLHPPGGGGAPPFLQALISLFVSRKDLITHCSLFAGRFFSRKDFPDSQGFISSLTA